jgi:hypothetical protein
MRSPAPSKRTTWFDGLIITHAADGTITPEGSIRDQSALYGLIDKPTAYACKATDCLGLAHDMIGNLTELDRLTLDQSNDHLGAPIQCP